MFLSFVGRTVDVAATRLCCSSATAATDDMWTNERGYAPIKLFLQTDGRLSFTPHSILKISNTEESTVLSTWLIPKAALYKSYDKCRDTMIMACNDIMAHNDRSLQAVFEGITGGTGLRHEADEQEGSFTF